MKNWYAMSLLALLWACGPSEKETALTKEALAHHEAAMAAEKEVKAVVKELAELKPALASLRDSLAADTTRSAQLASVLAQLDKVEADFATWRKGIVEVPGHEHHHEHGEGHDHDHDHTPVQATPEQMVGIQQEMKDQVLKIKTEAGQALASAKELLRR
jgi:predicted  nucleic acid-binding Zn-ribbon protein